MKKFLLVSLLLGSIIFAGCRQQQLSQDELFEKKQECASYRDELEKRNEQFNYSGNDQNGLYRNSSTIEQIFYSPEYNSCLFTRLANLHYNTEEGKPNVDFWFIIEDALTHEQIWNSLPVNGESYEINSNKFEETIQVLKGEKIYK